MAIAPQALILACCFLAGWTLTSGLPQERVARETEDSEGDELWELLADDFRRSKEEEADVTVRAEGDGESDSEDSDNEGFIAFAERWINRIQAGLQRVGEIVNWIREATRGTSEAAEKEARYLDPQFFNPIVPGPLPPPPHGFLRPVPIPGSLHYPAPLPPFRPFRRPCHRCGFHRHFIGFRPIRPGVPPIFPPGEGKDVPVPEVVPPKEVPVEEKPEAWPEGGGKDIEGAEIDIPKDVPVEETPDDWGKEAEAGKEDLGGIPENEVSEGKPEELPKPAEEESWPEDGGVKDNPEESWPEEDGYEDKGARGNDEGAEEKPAARLDGRMQRGLNEREREYAKDVAAKVLGGEMEARALAREHRLKFLRRASS